MKATERKERERGVRASGGLHALMLNRPAMRKAPAPGDGEMEESERDGKW